MSTTMGPVAVAVHAPPESSDFRAGVARVDITPPMPADWISFARRAAPATGVLAPLTATALVVEDGVGRRVVIVAMDLIAIGCAQADRIREIVADAVDVLPDAIFLNYSHTHAGPHATEGSLRKLSVSQRSIYEEERLFIASLSHKIVGVAAMAARDLVPARGGARAIAGPGVSVNGRERTGNGRTNLGWNADAPLDDEPIVLKFSDTEDRTVALIVNFACHPVVLGGINPNVGPDYPGTLGSLVEHNVGGCSVFVAGAGGNVLPLEGFYEEAGPEINVGERLGFVAVHAPAQVSPYSTHVERMAYGSVIPISLGRP